MTRIVQVPHTDDRIDLQPNGGSVTLFNVDPTTGLQADTQFDIVDATGELIQTDTDGQPALGPKNPVSIPTQITNYSYSRILESNDFSISELTGTEVSIVLPTNDFGRFCEVKEPDTVNQLQLLIDRLRLEIDSLNRQLLDQSELQSRIESLKSDLSDLTDEMEVLVIEIEELRHCNESLTTSLESRDEAVQTLSIENRNLSLENARLVNLTGDSSGYTNPNDDANGNPVSFNSLTEIRRIGNLIIGRLTPADRQAYNSEIGVVQTSTVIGNLFDSMDSLISRLSPLIADAMINDIESLEGIFGRRFTYTNRESDNINLNR